MEKNKDSPAKRKKPWYAPLAHFMGHAVVGTGIFLIVGAPAVFLGFLTHKLREYHVAEFTISVLQFLEHTILVIDSLLFLAYLAFTTWSAIQEYVHEGKSD